MQSISVFFNVIKAAHFWWKHADTSRTQVVYCMIYTFFLDFFKQGTTIPSFNIVGNVWHILGIGGLSTSHPRAALF